jgi:hypothetical protein
MFGIDSDTLAVAIGVIAQGLIGVIGVKLSVTPVTSRREARIYVGLVVALVTLSGAVILWQHRRGSLLQGETNSRLLTIQEQTKQPPVFQPKIEVRVPPAQPPIITIAPSAQPTRRLPLPRYPLGGDMGAMFGPQKQWFPVFNHADVQLDWSTLDNIDAAVEVKFIAQPLNTTQGGGGGSLSVRVRNVASGTSVAQGKWFFSSGDFTNSLPLPRSVGVEKYRLEILPEGEIAVAVSGSIVLSWQPEERPRR